MGSFDPLGKMQRNIVGEPEYKKIPPNTIHDFRDAPQSEQLVLPEKFENRKCTDVAFLIILLLFVLSMYAFSIAMCIRHSPSSGGHRGEKNKERGVSFLNDSYHNEPYKQPRAGRDERKQESLIDFIKPTAWVLTVIVVMPLVGFAIMMLVFVGLRWKAKVSFWILTGIDLTIFTVFAVYFWYKTARTSGDHLTMNYIFYANFFTFCLIFLIVLIVCLRKRLPLIFATYEEALKAIFRVPGLLFTPLLTILVLLLSMSVVVSVPLIAYLRQSFDRAFWAFLVLSLFKFGWVQQFVRGSQCMVVAFAVASFYFTRDKTKIRSSYCTSLYAYFRFHAGTVAAGSLIIAITTLFRVILECATKNTAGNRNLCGVCIRICCLCCIICLQEIVEYVTRKAYIMTAIHGKSLCKSGKRAMRLLWINLLDTLTVDKICSLAMTGAVLLITAVTLLIGYMGIQEHHDIASTEGDNKTNQKEKRMANFVLNGVIPFTVPFLLTLLVTVEYMAVLSVAIETIFLCFCEDKDINDGSPQRPYYMNQGLLNVIQKAFDEKFSSKNRRHQLTAR